MFLLVAAVGTAQGMAEANPNRDFAFRLGYGMPSAIPGIAIVGVVVLILSVGGYLVLRDRGGLTFSQTVISWPSVIVTGVVAAFYLFG